MTNKERILKLIEDEPDLPMTEVATRLGVHYMTVIYHTNEKLRKANAQQTKRYRSKLRGIINKKTVAFNRNRDYQSKRNRRNKPTIKQMIGYKTKAFNYHGADE